jgi:cytochrome c oxidase subunit I
VNVIIWAHHVYLDYPEDTIQGAINIAMQPLTFTITLVSALSIYSLSATMFRSRFKWTPASTLLVAGIFGWLTAGISGVVNATIEFNDAIHNTLWVVGHFHHMALLNIGIVVLAGVYAYLPELTGKRWYSRHLAWWHVWLTLIGDYGMIIPWLIQGLLGAPRRYSILPGATTAGPTWRSRSSAWSPWASSTSPGTWAPPCAASIAPRTSSPGGATRCGSAGRRARSPCSP